MQHWSAGDHKDTAVFITIVLNNMRCFFRSCWQKTTLKWNYCSMSGAHLCFLLVLCGLRGLDSPWVKTAEFQTRISSHSNILSPAWSMCSSEHTELFYSNIKSTCLWCLHSSADKGLPVMATLDVFTKKISLLPGWIYKANSCSTQATRHWVFCHGTG